MNHDVYINGLGVYLPGSPVASSDMEDYLGQVNGTPSKNRAFILRQNKIKTRHYAIDKNGNTTNSSVKMSTEAIQEALKNSECSQKDITYLASSSTLGDQLVPGLASQIHGNLNIPPIEIANFNSVCASSLMAIKSAWLQLKTDEHKCAAVSGCELASRYFRPGFYEGTDEINEDGKLSMEADFLRFTLSDGAGAAILENRPNTNQRSLKINWIDLRSYADRFDNCMTAGYITKDHEKIRYWSEYETLEDSFKAGSFILKQDFSLMQKMIQVWVAHYLDLIDQGKIIVDKVDHLCSHYSSHSLRKDAIKILKKTGSMISEDKWFTNLYTKGNTGTASIFIILEELFRTKDLQPGQKILCHVPESGRCVNGFMMLEVV